MLIRLLSVDEVMWCRQQSVNHQGLLCSLHCATTVVLREQLNLKSAVIRSERSSCYNTVLHYFFIKLEENSLFVVIAMYFSNSMFSLTRES